MKNNDIFKDTKMNSCLFNMFSFNYDSKLIHKKEIQTYVSVYCISLHFMA